MKKSFFATLLLIVVLCTVACSQSKSVTSVSIGDGLPEWELDEAHTAEPLSETMTEQGIVGIYTTDAGDSDVYVYRFSNDDGISLEKFGQQMAAERNIFCNMMKDEDVPVAVLNYHDCIDANHYIVQAFIYETDDSFVEVCTLYKTDLIPLGSGNLSVHMIREYEAKEQENSTLPFDTIYTTDNERLPKVRILQFPKNEFPVETVEPGLKSNVSQETLDTIAKDGWTLDDFVSLYNQVYDLKKGEVTSRNNLEHAFIGCIDDGIFKTRAFIDDGDFYTLLSAEAEASKFQHITNALIDAIERN